MCAYVRTLYESEVNRLYMNLIKLVIGYVDNCNRLNEAMINN